MINRYLIREALLIFFDIIYYIILFRIIMSFVVQMVRGNRLLVSIYQTLSFLTEPLLAPIRKVIPPVRMGMGYMDFSPLILLFLLMIIRRAILFGL